MGTELWGLVEEYKNFDTKIETSLLYISSNDHRNRQYKLDWRFL